MMVFHMSVFILQLHLAGGVDKRDLSADLVKAIQALSQLSYTPIFRLRLQKF